MDGLILNKKIWRTTHTRICSSLKGGIVTSGSKERCDDCDEWWLRTGAPRWLDLRSRFLPIVVSVIWTDQKSRVVESMGDVSWRFGGSTSTINFDWYKQNLLILENLFTQLLWLIYYCTSFKMEKNQILKSDRNYRIDMIYIQRIQRVH